MLSLLLRLRCFASLHFEFDANDYAVIAISVLKCRCIILRNAADVKDFESILNNTTKLQLK